MPYLGAIWFESFSCISRDSCLKNDCFKIILRSGKPDVPICGGFGSGTPAEYGA